MHKIELALVALVFFGSCTVVFATESSAKQRCALPKESAFRSAGLVRTKQHAEAIAALAFDNTNPTSRNRKKFAWEATLVGDAVWRVRGTSQERGANTLDGVFMIEVCKSDGRVLQMALD